MSTARETAALIVTQRDRPTFSGRCEWCGAQCYGRSCRAHADLTRGQNSLLRTSNEPNPASTANGSGSSTRKEA